MSVHRMPNDRFARVFETTTRFIVFGLLLTLIFALTFTAKGAPNPLEDTVHRVYLPLLTRPLLSPTLNSPSNGAVLNTLIPTLEWKNMGQPVGTRGCIALDINPNPPACTMYFSMGNNESDSWLVWWNLKPGTKYYWRVGAIYNNDYTSPNWSEEWTFKTGSSGKIPGAPQLVSPGDYASLAHDQRLFTWSAVPGALDYALGVYNPDKDWTYLYFGNTNQRDLRNISNDFFQVNTQYYWFVSARNDYAWSPDSTPRAFTLTSVLNSALRSLSQAGLRGMDFIEEQPDGRMRFTIPTEK